MSATEEPAQPPASQASFGRPHVAVVACMDARLYPREVLGLGRGEAHIIRNAGGVVTEDVLRSLVISQRLLGTTSIVLLHHTDCGMLTFRDDDLRARIATEVGYKPLFAMQAFADLDEDVRHGIARIRNDPFLLHRAVRGFVCDIATAELREIR